MAFSSEMPHPFQLSPPRLPAAVAALFPATSDELEEEEGEEEAPAVEPKDQLPAAGIEVVHLLMSCASSVHRGDPSSALSLLRHLRALLPSLPLLGTFSRVASHFLHALSLRLAGTTAAAAAAHPQLHRAFYEALPCLKFAHFTSNQCILDAALRRTRLHLLDLSPHPLLLHLPPLLHALALRPGGPPQFRLTSILPDAGALLAPLARSLGVPFTFLHLPHPDSLPLLRRSHPDELLAVSSLFYLHRVPALLDSLAALRPDLLTVAEQEADHNQDGFLERFTEALFYYSAMFDALDACAASGPRAAAEGYLREEICNVVSAEGEARVERHEPLSRWRARMRAAGFEPRAVGSNAFRQAATLLGLSPAGGGGFAVEEADGCMLLAWHGRPLVSASAWQPQALPHGGVSAWDGVPDQTVRIDS